MNRCRHGSLRGNRSKNHRGHRGHGGFYFFSRWSSSLSLRGSLGRGVFPFSVFLRVLCVLRGFHLFFLSPPSPRVRQPRRFEPPAARGTALPLRRSRVARNLFQGPTAEHRRVDRRDVVSLHYLIVVLLDHQPLVPLAPRTPPPHFDQREVSFQPLPVQTKLQISLGQHRRRFRFCAGRILPIHRNRRKRLPCAHIPHDHGSGAVVVLGNVALEIEIRNGMILHVHRQPLVRRIERRPLRHRPRFQHAFHLQAEVVVQPRRIVHLHDKPIPRLRRHFRRRLRRLLKPSFPLIFLKRHRDRYLTTESRWRNCGTDK